jgi:hypothetical protein
VVCERWYLVGVSLARVISEKTIVRMENPSWLTLPATGGLNRPPTRTRLQLLPFGELEWENFERLCYRLARTDGDVERWAALYGSRGQKQEGIDIYVRRPGAKPYACWQSKRYKHLTPAKLKAAIAEFEKGGWATKSDEFAICTSASIQDTKIQTEIEIQTTRLKVQNIKLRVLGQTELSTELKNNSKLVRDFFGRDWVHNFCDGVDDTADTLDVTEIATIRAELRKLYVSNFSSIDPGILASTVGKASSSGLLPILDRFVEPDVEVIDAGNLTEGPTKPAEPSASVQSDLSPNGAVPSRPPPPSRELVRRRVSSWVAEDDHTVIVGDAGLGKSTSLRAFALDMLDDGKHFPSVAQRWAECIPIVMPFAFWARLVEKDEASVSLPDAVAIWFKKFDVSGVLLTLILRSLEEHKALLLVDGLDEWSNESAARSTLTLLTTFIKTKGIPAIVTGRPGGLARLGTLDPMWRQARLAALSDKQQRLLTTIWFGHLYPGDGRTRSVAIREQAVKTQVANFFSDLVRSGTLLTLSGVPLLLSGLISLYVRQVALPRSRFQAYEELIQLLLEIHPSRRAQATLDRAPRFAVLADAALRKQTLAHLAYHKRLHGYDAGYPVLEARVVIVEYLQSLDGAGLPPRDAIAGAKELLTVDADTAGLLIEKAPEEIGFVHAVFEEALVGFHLARWHLKDQGEFIKTNGGNPRWTTSILAMLHALTRPSDIDVLVGAMTSPELAAAADVVRQTLAAEVIFGDFCCSPRLAAELTPAFIRMVTTDTWFPHREALLRLILESAVSSSARESVRDRPHEWFPDPLTFRERIYPMLKYWPKDAALLELLWLGLFNDRDENKHAAASTLAALFAGDAMVGDRLHALCLSVVDGETLCAALEALMQGWWDYKRLKDLIVAARSSAHPHLRLVGMRGRIKAKLQDGDDLDEVMAMAKDDRLTMGAGHPLLFQTLAAGWPNDPKIIAASVTAVTVHGWQNGISREIAKSYLLHFAQANPELESKVAEMIREDEHFFSPAFGRGYIQGKYGPAILAALDFRLERMNRHMHHDIAHLAVMSRSPYAKQALIAMLKDDRWIFWPVYGLLAGWGMTDEEVAAALLAVAAGPPDNVQFLAHHLPEIILDRTQCRAKLLEIARLEKVERLDFLLTGFGRLGTPYHDTEVMEAVLRHDYFQRGVFDATASLISAFGGHSAVRSIALTRLTELDAPWEVLIETYAGDAEIRGIITRYLSSLPVALRSVLVSALGRRAADDTILKDRLLQYRLDSNAAVRTASAIAYYEAVGSDVEARAAAVVQLREDAATIGPWMDMVRQAALAGFIALDEVAMFRDVPEWQPDKKVSLDVFGFDNNRQILSYIAKHWDRVTRALGPDLFERLSRHASNEWWCWDNLAPYISESPILRSDFLAYSARETKALSGRAIEALAREVPRSHLLREHCLRCLTNGPEDLNASPYENRRRELVVGRILGRQFADDLTIREQLEKHVRFRPSAAIVGLSLAWKDSPTLVNEFSDLRARGRQTRRFVWPDAAYLASTVGSRDDFCGFLGHFLENSSGNMWDFPSFCIEPIVERIKTEAGLAAHIIARVRTASSGSEKASLPRLLAQANQMIDDLREWCEEEFVRQSDHTVLAEFGLDAVSGEIRPVAHALLEALSPSRY